MASDSIRWGAILVGVVAGIGFLAVPAGLLLALGVADTGTLLGQTVLVAIGFVAQFLAGYVAARVASAGRPLTGGLTAVALYAAVGVISISAGDQPGALTLAVGAAVALLLGTSAGVLAESREHR